MEEIKNWLSSESPDFGQGLNLLEKYSRNRSIVAFIRRRKEMQFLVYELTKLSKIPALKVNPHWRSTTPISPAVEVKKVVIDDRKIKREDLAPAFQEVYDKNVADYKELRILHEKMKQANSDAGRAEFRERIVKINEAIKTRWHIIDTGEFPEDKPPQANINSARAYISKMLRKKELTKNQRELVKQKYDIIITAGETLKEETLAKLKEAGF